MPSNSEHFRSLFYLSRRVNELFLYQKDKYSLIEEVCKSLIEVGKCSYALIVLYDESKRYTAHSDAGSYAHSSTVINELLKYNIPPCSKKFVLNCNIVPKTSGSVCGKCYNRNEHSKNRVCILRLESKNRFYGVLFLVSDNATLKNEEHFSLFTEIADDLGFALGKIELSNNTSVENRRDDSDRLFRILTENTRDGLVITEDDKIVFINRKIKEIFGYEEEEFKNISLKDLVDEATIELLKENRARNRKQDELEFWIRRKDGKKKYIRYRETAIRDPKKSRLIVITNITGKKENEQEIIRQQVYFKRLFENSPLGILIIDNFGKILNSNRGFEKMFQYSPKETIGKYSRELIMPASLKDKEGSVEEVINTGERLYEETIRRRKDNRIINVERYCYPIIINQKVAGLYSLYNDISERKLAEEYTNFQARMLDNIGQAVVATNLNGEIIYCNKAFEKIYGWKREEVRYQNIVDILPAGGSTQQFREVMQMIREGKKFEGEFSMLHKDGSEFPAMVTSTSLYDTNNNLVGCVSVSFDLTAQKQIENALKLAKDKAEESDKIKSDFLAQMSHEIRTPINSILSFTSLIREEIKDNMQSDLLFAFDYIKKGSDRLIRTIDMLLNMAQIQSESYSVNMEEINLFDDVIKYVYNEFSIAAKKKSLDYRINNTLTDLSIKADKHTVTQIFQNLVDNAIKFTTKGYVEISIYSKNDDTISVDVKDTGIGISEEYLPKLFMPFSQEEMGYTRRFEGNGLGLALIKKYTELNNSSISVKSQKGSGTVFTVNFNKAEVKKESNKAADVDNDYAFQPAQRSAKA